jgi:hypothetical protein
LFLPRPPPFRPRPPLPECDPPSCVLVRAAVSAPVVTLEPMTELLMLVGVQLG